MAGVLVVDDDASIREAVRFVLEDEGYRVDEASHGLAALDFLRNASTLYVVLLDLMMPHLDGYGVLRMMRTGGEDLLARHAYIVVSAHGGALPPQARDLGIGIDIPLIAKPFELEHLLAGVATAAHQLHAPRGGATAPESAHAPRAERD